MTEAEGHRDEEAPGQTGCTQPARQNLTYSHRR